MNLFSLKSEGRVISEATDPTGLDWPALQGSENWTVCFCEGVVADVVWPPAECYRLQEGALNGVVISRHDLIVPIVRGAVLYKYIFGMLRGPIIIRPLES